MLKETIDVEKQHKLFQNRKEKETGELKPKMTLNVTLRDDGGCFQVERASVHKTPAPRLSQPSYSYAVLGSSPTSPLLNYI